jgi:hypothetical protein
MYYHQTIKRYMGTILHILNNLQVQFADSKGNICQKNVPIVFASREKSVMLEDFTEKQLLSTNLNVIPRGFVKFTTMVRSESRMQNKNLKINTYRSKDNISYQYNCIPYDFTFDCMIKCRGMTETCMLMEQLAVWFNPNLNIEIYDADFEDAPTDITIKLLDINPQINDYDEASQHIIEIVASFTICGWLYTPVRTQGKVKEFIFRLRPEDMDDHITVGYDVEDGHLKYEDYTSRMKASKDLKIDGIDIIKNKVPVDFLFEGSNAFKVKFTKAKHAKHTLVVESLTDGVDVIDDHIDVPKGVDEVQLRISLYDEFGNNYIVYKTLQVKKEG